MLEQIKKLIGIQLKPVQVIDRMHKIKNYNEMCTFLESNAHLSTNFEDAFGHITDNFDFSEQKYIWSIIAKNSPKCDQLLFKLYNMSAEYPAYLDIVDSFATYHDINPKEPVKMGFYTSWQSPLSQAIQKDLMHVAKFIIERKPDVDLELLLKNDPLDFYSQYSRIKDNSVSQMIVAHLESKKEMLRISQSISRGGVSSERNIGSNVGCDVARPVKVHKI